MDRTDEAIRRGKRAEIGLSDNIWLEAFDNCKSDILKAMAEATNRDDCWDKRCELHGLETARRKLVTWVTNGSIAQQTIDKK